MANESNSSGSEPTEEYNDADAISSNDLNQQVVPEERPSQIEKPMEDIPELRRSSRLRKPNQKYMNAAFAKWQVKMGLRSRNQVHLKKLMAF